MPGMPCNEPILCISCIMDALSYSATAPTPFIVWSGYPRVRIGFLAHQIQENLPFDDPRAWAASNLPITKLMQYRRVLAHHHQPLSVHAMEKLHEISREIAMGAKPAEVEVALKERPVFKLHVNPYTAPFGPSAMLTKVDIVVFTINI